MLYQFQEGQFGRTVLHVIGTECLFENAVVTQAFPASNFTTASTTNVNLLNGLAGATITATITIAAGAAVWISAGFQYSLNNPASVTVAVNDGTTDYDVGQAFTQNGGSDLTDGDILITGLAAGTYTFTLRARTSANTVTFGTAQSAFLRVQEVLLSNVKNISRARAGAYNIAAAANIDLLDQAAGNDYSVAINKLANTNLVVWGYGSCRNTTGNRTEILVASDGTNDFDIGSTRVLTTNGRTSMFGWKEFSGLGGGAFTPKLRVRSVGGTGNQWQDGSAAHRSNMTVFEAGLGGLNAAVVNRIAVGTFTWTSASYVDLLDQAGGATFTATVDKQRDDTKLIVVAGMTASINTTATVGLGVNDGTSDFDIARSSIFSGYTRPLLGAREFTGKTAGSHTFTGRVKTSANTVTFNTVMSAGIMVMETL